MTFRIPRRQLLIGAAATTTMLSAPAILRAQTRQLTMWSTQRAPDQVAAYEAIFAKFAEENPGLTVSLQYMGEDDLLPKLAASLAAGAPPDLISHMPPEFVMHLNEQGVLHPVDDVINAVGIDDFYENTTELLYDDEGGYFPGLAIVNSTTTGALWYRKDMADASGFADWNAMLGTVKDTTKGGVFGTIYPFGKTNMGDKLLLQTIWRAGGMVLNPDGSVAFNSPETIAAFDYVKELAEYSPSGSVTYGYSETINGFVEGRAASAPYSGRVLINVAQKNPSLTDAVSVVPYPMAEGGRDVFTGDFQSLVMPVTGEDPEAAKLLALALLRRDNYIDFLHVTPSHNLPNLKSVATSDEYFDNPIMTKYRPEVDAMILATSKGRSLLKETPEHPVNTGAGAIIGARIMTEALQDVIVGGVPSQEAAQRGADRITELLSS